MTTIDRVYSPLDALRAIEPIIRAHADQSERQATLATPIVEAIREQGLFQSLVPASLGGHEIEPLEWFRCVEAAARIHASTGWILMINGGAAAIGKFMDDETAASIFGNGGVFSGGAFPLGRAAATQGGYVVSGRWPYGSGVKHASHLMAMCLVHEGDAPRMGGHGGPDVRFICIPASEARIFDTWEVSGLSGTGSHDFAIENVFVPEARALPIFSAPGNSHYQGPLYRMPFILNFALPICAVALGIAQQAIDLMVELAGTKVPAGTQTPLKDRPLFHVQLAEATALVGSARAWMHLVIRDLWNSAERGDPIDAPRRVTAGLAASNATRNSREAVELMYLAGGATANYLKSPLQQCVRDILAVTQHTVTAPATWEQHGAVLAGGALQNPLFAV